MKYFDAHCDTMCELSDYALYRDTAGTLRRNSGQLDLARAARYDHYAQVFALFCGSKPVSDAQTAHIRFSHLLQTAQQQLADASDCIRLCRTAADLEQAERNGKAAAFLAIEGAELLQSEEDIRRAIHAGVRIVTLTWNHRSCYGCGAVTDNCAGLTTRGKQLVKRLTQDGVCIDVSHLSERGFWDLTACTDAPIIATHSNSKAVCPHVRNLTDDQFGAIISRGGLVGINLYVPFLTRKAHADCSDILRHIEHFCALGGENHLCIGADWDGCDHLPDGIADITGIQRLAETMARHGYTDAQIENIFYNNAKRFVQENF